MTAEQNARDILERAGVGGSDDLPSGNLVELADLILSAEKYRWLLKNCVIEVGNHGDKAIHFECDFDHFDDVDASVSSAMNGVRR